MQALVGIGSGMAKIDPATEFDLQKSKAGPGRIHDLKDSVTQQAIQCHYMPLSPPQMSTPPPSIRNAKKKREHSVAVSPRELPRKLSNRNCCLVNSPCIEKHRESGPSPEPREPKALNQRISGSIQSPAWILRGV